MVNLMDWSPSPFRCSGRSRRLIDGRHKPVGEHLRPHRETPRSRRSRPDATPAGRHQHLRKRSAMHTPARSWLTPGVRAARIPTFRSHLPTAHRQRRTQRRGKCHHHKNRREHREESKHSLGAILPQNPSVKTSHAGTWCSVGGKGGAAHFPLTRKPGFADVHRKL